MLVGKQRKTLLSFILIAAVFYNTYSYAFIYNKENCPFETPELLKKQLIASGKYMQLMINYAPSSSGHMLILPHRCIERFEELTSDEIIEFGEVVKIVRQAFVDVIGVPDYFILQKNGESAGQTVQHLHFHVVPVKGGEMLDVVNKTFNINEREKLQSQALQYEVNKYREYLKSNNFKFKLSLKVAGVD